MRRSNLKNQKQTVVRTKRKKKTFNVNSFVSSVELVRTTVVFGMEHVEWEQMQELSHASIPDNLRYFHNFHNFHNCLLVCHALNARNLS